MRVEKHGPDVPETLATAVAALHRGEITSL
jgi:hypothetical protein